jgi:hypothetical protein
LIWLAHAWQGSERQNLIFFVAFFHSMYHDDGYVVHGVAVSISSWDGMIDAEHGIDIDTLTIGMTGAFMGRYSIHTWHGVIYIHTGCHTGSNSKWN